MLNPSFRGVASPHPRRVILGREAAYRKTDVTLAALLEENRKLEFNLAGLKS